ncbi:MAG: type II toxin-antitoxin system RelE/ParE family toxin [Chitinophagales bacterium]
MIYTIVLLERAIAESNEAYHYYEEQQKGLGLKFEEALYKAIFYIQRNPEHFRVVKNKIRQLLIPKFPYLIIYRIVKDKIYIQSVFHTSRNPKKKFKTKK